MSSTSSDNSNNQICFHFLVGKCEYGDECYKRHLSSAQSLTTRQMLAFTHFKEKATRPAPVVPPTPAVDNAPPAKVVEAKPVQPKAEPKKPEPSVVLEDKKDSPVEDDDRPSCMQFPIGRCSNRNRKCLAAHRHRNLTHFTEEELAEFQVMVTKLINQQ